MNPDTRLFLDINGFARATPWLHGPVAAIRAPLGMSAALAVNQPIAAPVGEPRPYTALPNLLVLARFSHDPSFPGDHAVMAGAVAGGVVLVHRRLGIPAALAAVAMAFSLLWLLSLAERTPLRPPLTTTPRRSRPDRRA